MVFAHVFVLSDFVCFRSSIAVSECFATGFAAGCVTADVKSCVDVSVFTGFAKYDAGGRGITEIKM